MADDNDRRYLVGPLVGLGGICIAAFIASRTDPVIPIILSAIAAFFINLALWLWGYIELKNQRRLLRSEQGTASQTDQTKYTLLLRRVETELGYLWHETEGKFSVSANQIETWPLHKSLHFFAVVVSPGSFDLRIVNTSPVTWNIKDINWNMGRVLVDKASNGAEPKRTGIFDGIVPPCTQIGVRFTTNAQAMIAIGGSGLGIVAFPHDPAQKQSQTCYAPAQTVYFPPQVP